MRFAWLVAGAALTFIVVPACSSQGSPIAEKTSAKSQAIQGGTSDTADTYAVGLCGGQKGYCQAICSGALILPNLVVTARHCVDYLADPQVNCANNPQFGSRMFGPGGQANLWVTTNSEELAQNGSPASAGWHSVKKIYTPNDAHVCGHDIALVILNDIIPGSEAKPIVPGVQYPMNDPKYATRFTAIGFGSTSPANQGAGTRRIKQNIRVLCIPGDELIDCPADANINPAEFVGGDGTCEGDSGSSAYEQSSYGTASPLSFGVLSRGGVSADNTACQGSIYSRLDAWRDLVIQAATDASNNWTNYPKPQPDWTVYVPPPATPDGGPGKTPTTTPSGLGFGETCAAPSECATGQCIDPGNGQLFCSKDCTADADCPDSYVCDPQATVCVAGAAKPKTTTTTTSGCSMASGDPEPTPWRWSALALGLVALAVSRRRR